MYEIVPAYSVTYRAEKGSAADASSDGISTSSLFLSPMQPSISHTPIAANNASAIGRTIVSEKSSTGISTANPTAAVINRCFIFFHVSGKSAGLPF